MLRALLTLLVLSAALLGPAGCGRQQPGQLRISANPWIGFTPLVYAQKKGWLDESRIKFLWVVGLEENVKLYRQGLSDGFVATQYEYLGLGENGARPYILFDRSFGADVILSNRPVEALHDAGTIDAYLEITTLNNDLLQAFVRESGLECEHIAKHPSDPEALAALKPERGPALLVAYEPYATAIEKNGFTRVASTRELKSVTVIDALWLNAQRAAAYRDDLALLKRSVDRAVLSLKNDPEEFYHVVKGYLEGQSYEEFRASLEGIDWINTDPPASALSFLKSQQIATDGLLP